LDSKNFRDVGNATAAIQKLVNNPNHNGNIELFVYQTGGFPFKVTKINYLRMKEHFYHDVCDFHE